MSDLFGYLKDIITFKQNLIEYDLEESKDFQPYLIQRWLSMYSDEFADICNESLNVSWSVMKDKESWYKMFLGCIPKRKMKKISYVKKKAKKKSHTADADVVKLLARQLEISKREASMYIENGNVDVKRLKKELGL